MVLPVRSLIHCGTGRFCFCAFASFCLVRKVLWLCRTKVARQRSVPVMLFYIPKAGSTASSFLVGGDILGDARKKPAGEGILIDEEKNSW